MACVNVTPPCPGRFLFAFPELLERGEFFNPFLIVGLVTQLCSTASSTCSDLFKSSKQRSKPKVVDLFSFFLSFLGDEYLTKLLVQVDGTHPANQVGYKKLSRTVADLHAKKRLTYWATTVHNLLGNNSSQIGLLVGRPTYWATTVHNFCGLACIFGPTSSHNQSSLTTEKRSAKGMIPPRRAGKASHHLGVLQAVHITIAKQDALRQCALPLRLLGSRSLTNPLKGQRLRPHMHRRKNKDSSDKQAMW